MKILFLSRWFPFPATNGSKLRIASLLRALSNQHEVTFVGFSDDPQSDSGNPEIHRICKIVQLFQWKPYHPASLKARLGFFNPAPRFIVDTFSKELADFIRTLIQSGDYQAVVASQIDMASYAHLFKPVPSIFEEVESGLFFTSQQNTQPLRQRIRNSLTRYKRQHYLHTLLAQFKEATVVSEEEKALLKQIDPGYSNVTVIPNCIELERYLHVSQTPVLDRLIFTGSFRYSANYDAMVWFLDEVFPRVQALLPEVTLTITGDHGNKPLPTNKSVKLTGFVDDIMPLISSAGCSIVPLRVGGGTRLKILEAMALGTPVVTTSKGAEGLDVQDGYHLLIANTPDAMASAIFRLSTETGLRDNLITNARKLVKEKYDCKVVLPRFLNLVQSLENKR
jgi:glycosyltransferase involved in cell wall biosynthesis